MNLKEHWNEHKWKYAAGGAVVFAGITCFIMRGHYTRVQRVLESGVQRVPDELGCTNQVTISPLSFLSKQTNHVVTVIEREGRGHPGYRIRDLNTGQVWLSQAEAALDLNTYPSVISGHIKGKLPDVNGHQLERIVA